MNIIPIGLIKSPVTEPRDENWADVVSEIHLSDRFVKGLEGLEAFSHVTVVFFMHQATFDAATDLVRRPRGRDDMPLIGIFAQRARHRPNQIGITTVRILHVKEGVLTVKGLDAINDTPVLDLKPCFPAWDEAKNAVAPKWVDELIKNYF